ncbi:MAG: 2-oxoglutarate and iron-dependent oxygenase domain-containing protein [Parachlamydiaceae bacterium]
MSSPINRTNLSGFPLGTSQEKVTTIPAACDSMAAAEQKQDKLLSPSDVISATASIIEDADIPLFDFVDLQQAEGERRKELIRRFGEGLRDVGFVAVKAESLIPLVDAANVEMEKYFSQPQEEKMKDWRKNHGTGFSPQGRETAAGARKADLKETYFIPPNFTDWPKGREKFQEVMSNYHKEFTKLAALFMGFLAEFLGEVTEDITTSMQDAYNLIRLAHYPAPRPDDDPQAVWAAAHEDLNALTLLPPSKVPGLQLMTKEGEWKAVNIPQGYILVNTGEQVQHKTAGLIRATRHQVVNPGGVYARQKRLASIFFASWSAGFSLKPFESCVTEATKGMTAEEKEKYLKSYPDINVEQNLNSRLIEMRTIPNPPESMVRELREKGLLRQPPEELKSLYPHLFAEG